MSDKKLPKGPEGEAVHSEWHPHGWYAVHEQSGELHLWHQHGKGGVKHLGSFPKDSLGVAKMKASVHAEEAAKHGYNRGDRVHKNESNLPIMNKNELHGLLHELYKALTNEYGEELAKADPKCNCESLKCGHPAAKYKKSEDLAKSKNDAEGDIHGFNDEPEEAHKAISEAKKGAKAGHYHPQEHLKAAAKDLADHYTHKLDYDSHAHAVESGWHGAMASVSKNTAKALYHDARARAHQEASDKMRGGPNPKTPSGGPGKEKIDPSRNK